MDGTTGETNAQTTDKEQNDITELPSGRVASSHGITPELINTAFRKAQERLGSSGGATLGGKPAEKSNPLESAGIEIFEQVPTEGERHIEAPATVTAEQTTIIQESAQKQDNPDQDLESMLETEKQQKIQEAQEAWGNLIKAMKESPVPFFTTSASKEMLFLIKPTRDPSNSSSEVYVVITKDGPKTIRTTKETRSIINKLYLNLTENPTVNNLETLEMTPLMISEASDPVSPVIKESQEMAAKIGEKRKEINVLETSKNLADKLMTSFNPQQASLTEPKI